MRDDLTKLSHTITAEPEPGAEAATEKEAGARKTDFFLKRRTANVQTPSTRNTTARSKEGRAH